MGGKKCGALEDPRQGGCPAEEGGGVAAGRQIGLQCVCMWGGIGGGGGVVETDKTKASTVSESCLPLDRRVVTLREGILHNRS